MMATATDYRLAMASLTGECAIADRLFSVSITELTCQGCEVTFNARDFGSWDRQTDFCKLSIANQLTINGRVMAFSGNSARIGFFGHIHPVAVDKLQRAAR